MSPTEQLFKNITALHHRDGLSQREVSVRMGLAPNSWAVKLAKLNKGISSVTVADVSRLCTIHNCTPNDILKDVRFPKKND